MGTLPVCVPLVVFYIISTQYINGLQIPQFLQKKYGYQYGSGYHETSIPGHSFSKIKSPYAGGGGGVKTSRFKQGQGYTKNTYGVKTQHPTPKSKFTGGCNQQPPTPMNSGIRCSMYGGCRANCIPNYQFPGGEIELAIICEDGKWNSKGYEWTVVPACEPICLPQCQNNGICIAPNQCNCPENFSGPQCQFENKPCLNHPPIPMNSKRMCRPNQCTVTCLNGHEFPDGSAIAMMECKNGLWVPTKDKWTSIPDCRATCNPACQNGGNCLSYNVCQCPQDFRGPQCQYSVDACSAKKLPINGGYNCSGNSESLSCSISCPEGIQFEFQPEPVYTCFYYDGFFSPTPIPKCVYTNNMEIIHLPGSSHTYYLPNGTGFNAGSVNIHGPSVVGGYPGMDGYLPTFAPPNKYSYNSPEEIYNSNINYVPLGNFGHNEHQLVTVQQKLPKPGSCFHWGGTHYKTFDGRIYSFESKCSHTLVRDAVDNTFSIVTQNHEDCYFNPIHCHKVIKIYLQDKQYFLKRTAEGTPIFSSSKKILPIPGQLPGIRVEMSAHHIVVSLDNIGMKIRWDGHQLVHVEAKEGLWNRTEGLCGRLDGEEGNDILTKDGQIPRSIVTLASSWKIEDIGDECDDVPTEEHVCQDTGVKGSLPTQATLFCKKLLSDKRFASCQSAVDIYSLLESCRWDYCTCKENDRSLCACETLNVYVRDCSHRGIEGLANWRDADTCPMECTGGKVYKACGPPTGQPGCGAATQVPEDREPCVEGCYCPEGTVLHENKCIIKEKCPCRLRGKMFQAGTSVPKDCNTCTCSEGQWICTQVACGSRCSAVGDPHYTTFDGKKYNFMGQCSYYLVKADNFSIEAENVACAGSISQAMNFPASIASSLPSCTKTVTIKINGQIIKLKQNHGVVVNGQDISKIPYLISGVSIKSASSILLLVKLPNGIEVWWDGVNRAYIDMPAEFKDTTRGLCGTFNNNKKDDFLTPEDDIEQAVIPFANKWKTTEKCNDIPEVLSSHPCDKNIHKKPTAENYCLKIKSNIFKDCHWYVDPEHFYDDCLYDMCSCEHKITKCLCPIIASYATECSRKGVKIDWRGEVRECGVHCPGGQKYQVCGNSCTRTCFDISVDPDCKQQCAEGCNCPEGQALDDTGECIPIGQCKCQHDGLEFPAGYKEVRPATNGPELCTCINALWDCKPASPTELNDFPRASDLKSRCNDSANMEFTTCEPVEPITCKNMHSIDYFSASVCHAGCQCKEGYVLDTTSHICVKPAQCPCHHGGRSYKENSTVQSDCNTCQCQNGKWKCTDRQCTAECSAWGDSHYKTFDGKLFDYQGQCDYVFAKGNLGSDAFDISIQNVPCGSLGTACSKAITIRISSGEETERITLSKEKHIPKYKTFKHMIIREKGLFVIMDAPDLGLVVHWDKGTRIYAKVDPRWKDKIKGLCGNYNDNDGDDFQTPSGGLVEVSANIFGDSWKLQPYCPEALEVTDTCQDRPDRKVWALKKCGVLKSFAFATCHTEVPVEYYFEKCVFDSCACDQGGDCECLCTALAAYAQECNNRGVSIKWRSQQLCPMQCDERCSKYSPCISTCPLETCDNLLINNKLSKTCGEDTCIEGCSPKPCPPEFIYSNSSYLECVPRNICKPFCLEENGVIYYEGDLMEEDDCHSCYCSREEKICKGQPCTTPTPQEFTTHQLEEIVLCKSGWTNWINQDKAPSTKSKPRNKQQDIEPIPTQIILNNLKESSRCQVTDMIDIECRTVMSHIPAKDTGLDVECSLERGLICKSAGKIKTCPDFEIRVLCQCEKKLLDYSATEYHPQITTETTVINQYDLTRCPPGMLEDSCAIECNNLCLYYFYLVKQKGLCLDGVKCESGCVSAEKKTFCPKGMLWANDHECVTVDECLCVSQDGNPLKPGHVSEESDCKKCQCIDNAYSCHSEPCEQKTTKPASTPKPEYNKIATMPPILIPTSITPPPKCDEDRFMDLIQGDQPLPDEAFNASSVLSPAFTPSNSRFSSRVSEVSGGSWAPKYSNEDQYLEIDLGRQEPVYGVITRGSPLYDEYVTSYKVLYSPDGHTFYYILNDEKYPIIFRGSIDTTTPIKQIFDTPIEAKVVRINPQTWNNGISLRVELIGCAEEKTTTMQTTLAYEFITVQPLQTKPQYCDDSMGLSDGTMGEHQILTSSDLSPENSKKYLKLNSASSWQPLTNSPSEWIQFDFLEPRNITGLVSKGGENGWVTAFAIKYSHNQKDWNPILNNEQKEKVFLGNYNSNSPQVTNFVIPINARYIRVIPTKWQNNIQMRVEMHGCYKPYPVVEVPSTVPPSPCNYCPGVEYSPLEMGACRCLADEWWNGEHCVNRTHCSCMVGHIPYAVGAIYELEDCSECICKLGGVSHCTPKKCDTCKEGLRSTVTSTCACTCQPCPENTVLCPTSNICINVTLWCNGVQDCPDDELDCPPITEAVSTTTTVAPTTTKKPVKECPVVICGSGFKKVELKLSKVQLSHSYYSPMISGGRKIKNNYKGISRTKSRTKGYSKPNLQKPLPIVSSELADEQLLCKEYKCIYTKPPPIINFPQCPQVICPTNYIPIYDEELDGTSKRCPTYSCYAPPPPDAVCNVTGRTFNTFDNIEYKYDICYHVLARDLEADEWDIALKKVCLESCSRDLIIRHQDHLFVLHPDLSIEFDGYTYTVEQTKSIGLQNDAFEVSQPGDTLFFVSHRYGFWIVWNKHGDIKLGVVHKLADKVDGLCGFFNDVPEDDKRSPDGHIAKTSVEFGDSWAISTDQPLICEAKTCPLHIQNKAWKMCNKVKEQSLSQCARVIDIEAFISRCLETTCTCLEHSLDNHTADEECRCHAMQAFVVDCLSANSTIDLSDWRMQQDCPITCETPLVYHDCYQRRCEPTCESISLPSLCPKVNNICFPGCYCPPGFVRKDETCIKPSSCRDCECNVLPHLQYITYDENNFTVTGNCVYVMSRDALIPGEQTHKFQVLVTNHPCKNKEDKICVGKVTILYEGHKIHILLDEYRNKLKLIVDSERIIDFDEISEWANVRETATKHLKFLLTALQVEVSVYYPSLGISVKAPSHKYGGKLEGLCGDCNGNLEDDIKTPEGGKPKDINDFALSWLYENLPGGQSRESCENKPKEECRPLPVDSDPCVQLVDVNKFGQCLNVLNPLLFIDWCQKDTCGGHPELACTAIEAYARDCANAGFCINWRNEYCPAIGCPTDQFYDPCGTSHPETCDVIQGKIKYQKKIIPTEGCYCPEGKVFLNDTCVVPKDCEVCDTEGHHPGDVWKKDKCTTCTCEGTSLNCETQNCPGVSTICEQGYNAIKVSSSEEQCCDKYACVPEPTAGPTCETPQKLVCGPGQIMKLDTKPNGCQTFICECKPPEDCDQLDLSTDMPMEPGYVKEVDHSGCCPVLNMVCKKDLCPAPNKCPEYHSLQSDIIEGKCCPLYSCIPPKEKCIYETQYTAAEKGGERPLTRYEKQNLLKGANETWQDGPCRECKCMLTNIGNYQPTCSETECPSSTSHVDFTDYQLKDQPVFEQCCPSIIRTACKYNGKVYQVGEKWPKGTDYCTTLECVDTSRAIQKETQVQSCDKNCDIGFQYVEPTPESQQCCGSCKQVACVSDGIVYDIGQEWTSFDHCTTYFCLNINGSLQVQAVLMICPLLPEEYLNDFIIETFPVEGECCSKHVQSACKVGEDVYRIGETWPSPDGDKCKNITCIEKENKELVKQDSTETCKKECVKGWEYRESKEYCCGECVQVACVADGEIKHPNENWTSLDNCTTFTCDDQFVVSGQQESCPSLEDCPEENIYVKGCCKHCNITTADQSLCTPEAIQIDKTIAIISTNVASHGQCVNKQPIPDFKECVGSCHSSTFFNIKSGLHESECTCCQATDYTSIYVKMECEDGHTWDKKIAVPSKCGCEGCAANKSSITKAQVKSVKTGGKSSRYI